METKKYIPLAEALKLAEEIKAELQPHCHRLEIAGSIRRRRPFCGDIDMVVLPKEPNEFTALFVKLNCVNYLLEHGRQNISAVLNNGFPIQIFLAQPQQQEMFHLQPSNWGSLLLCRTGSKEFNVWFAKQAISKGLHWNPYAGIQRGAQKEILASRDEADLFRALDLDFIPPEKRER